MASVLYSPLFDFFLVFLFFYYSENILVHCSSGFLFALEVFERLEGTDFSLLVYCIIHLIRNFFVTPARAIYSECR